jgi:hypothetical protein
MYPYMIGYCLPAAKFGQEEMAGRCEKMASNNTSTKYCIQGWSWINQLALPLELSVHASRSLTRHPGLGEALRDALGKVTDWSRECQRIHRRSCLACLACRSLFHFHTGRLSIHAVAVYKQLYKFGAVCQMRPVAHLPGLASCLKYSCSLLCEDRSARMAHAIHLPAAIAISGGRHYCKTNEKPCAYGVR